MQIVKFYEHGIASIGTPELCRVFPRRHSRIYNLILLTKPRIMLLVLLTGATALVLEGSLLYHPVKFALFLLGLYLTGGAANAVNQYFERDIDSLMERTKARRPVPLGLISPRGAILFSAVIGVAGIFLLAIAFNILTASLAAATLLFYGLFYTRWLKPRTPQNIVIGGIAGAMAPVGAWAAATDGTAPVAWILFLIVFLWTPPHFWSLVLCFRSDYEKTGLPMMPVVKSPGVALRLIFYYTLALVAVSFTYMFTGGGWLYLIAAAALGAVFIQRVWAALRRENLRSAWGLFTYSIFYLFGLFLVMVLDKILSG